MSDSINEQSRLHGKALSEAVKAQHPDAVPGNDAEHAHSHAAHLHTPGDVHSKPEGNLRQGSEPGARREPPQDPGRNGKGHNRE
ncbi:MAG: hypothetical protein ACRYGF_18815 [Janthinobacterium lividum]